MRVRLTVTALLVAGAMTLAGCGGDPAPVFEEAAGPVASQSAPAADEAPVVVPSILKFQGKTLEGQSFDAASLAGKPTVLWFWAPWCATCFGQAASVADMQRAHGDKVNLLGIAGLGRLDEMKQFVAEGDVANVKHLNDASGAVWKKFGIVEQSVYLILDKDGKVLNKSWLDSMQFEGKVAELAKA
ncbi:redoxin domain-containing protein [Phytohabitans aurantiacus]|jgi:thiol-disulfide isomerase/thioredoxin|uniref:Thiol:disulfide interchange protein n=1 Tax=Phytohabitans aurantiacus TaxID=3016789 RepID=A0ABQ5QTM3_9ACTN|nr:redoxin domain-containing protein [Phytohabitans aurantiacus]GLH97064.1 thiol:disulfide interchange protein [Phytohabitans aurantiacus]